MDPPRTDHHCNSPTRDGAWGIRKDEPMVMVTRHTRGLKYILPEREQTTRDVSKDLVQVEPRVR